MTSCMLPRRKWCLRGGDPTARGARIDSLAWVRTASTLGIAWQPAYGNRRRFSNSNVRFRLLVSPGRGLRSPHNGVRSTWCFPLNPRTPRGCRTASDGRSSIRVPGDLAASLAPTYGSHGNPRVRPNKRRNELHSSYRRNCPTTYLAAWSMLPNRSFTSCPSKKSYCNTFRIFCLREIFITAGT